jgi:hypothetical protein
MSRFVLLHALTPSLFETKASNITFASKPVKTKLKPHIMNTKFVQLGLALGTAFLVSCGGAEPANETPDSSDTSAVVAPDEMPDEQPEASESSSLFDWSKVANLKEQFIAGLTVKKEPMDVVVLSNLQAFGDLSNQYNEVLFTLGNYEELNSWDYIPLDEQPQEALDFTADVEGHGFRIMSVEGSIYLEARGDFIKEGIKDLVDATSWSFINLFVQEADVTCCHDGGIAIGHKELFTRIVEWGDLIEPATGTEYEETVIAMYKRNLGLYFSGLDNTPAYDFETHKYYTEFFNNMNEFVTNSPDRRASQDFAPFIELLKANDMKESEEIDAFVISRVR